MPMTIASRWKAGAASDTGLLRARNEDRYWVDNERGIFLVADGVGGHAAGEIAADTAVTVIRDCLSAASGPAEERVRDAIARANNVIYDMAREHEHLSGMACVLTLALVEDQEMVIGHVGDSRLYLIWKGAIRKLTSDHSPVGECEDAGELTEEEAMHHPRRNEVFRDVGSQPRQAGDTGFIEIRRCRLKPDAAFLICSDGLTDQLTSLQVREIVERYEGDPDRVVLELIHAANAAGGKDNTTALLVAGPRFRGHCDSDTSELPAAVARAAAQLRTRSRFFTGRFAFLVYGVLLGMLVWAVWRGVRG